MKATGIVRRIEVCVIIGQKSKNLHKHYGFRWFLSNSICTKIRSKSVFRSKKRGVAYIYDVYCVLSERCHNCCFDSFLKDINAINAGVPKIGLNEEHLMLLNTMIACVLIEYWH